MASELLEINSLRKISLSEYKELITIRKLCGTLIIILGIGLTK